MPSLALECAYSIAQNDLESSQLVGIPQRLLAYAVIIGDVPLGRFAIKRKKWKHPALCLLLMGI